MSGQSPRHRSGRSRQTAARADPSQRADLTTGRGLRLKNNQTGEAPLLRAKEAEQLENEQKNSSVNYTAEES